MKPADARILTINGGSSSIKFALYQVGEPLKRGLCGKVARIGLSGTNPPNGRTHGCAIRVPLALMTKAIQTMQRRPSLDYTLF